MSQLQISFHALLLRDVDVQWFDGLALAQAISPTQSGSRFEVPQAFASPSRIILCADGSLTDFAASCCGNPVGRPGFIVRDDRSLSSARVIRMDRDVRAEAKSAFAPRRKSFTTSCSFMLRCGRISYPSSFWIEPRQTATGLSREKWPGFSGERLEFHLLAPPVVHRNVLFPLPTVRALSDYAFSRHSADGGVRPSKFESLAADRSAGAFKLRRLQTPAYPVIPRAAAAAPTEGESGH